MLLIKGVSLAKRKTQCSLQMIKLRVKRIVTCTVQTSISRGLDIKFFTEMYAPNFLRFIHTFLSLFWSDKFTDFILMSWQPFNEENEFNFPFRAHFEINHNYQSVHWANEDSELKQANCKLRRNASDKS